MTIDKDFILSNAPHNINESVYVEHCNPGKKKLHITRKEHIILAHCFHCGESGAYSVKTPIYKWIDDSVTRNKYVPIPDDTQSLGEPLPEWVLKWISKADCPRVTMTDSYRFFYSPSRDTVIVLLNGKSYLERTNIPDKKALHRVHPEDKGQLWYQPTVPHETLVLVEDVISCVKLNHMGIYSIALMGTSINTNLTNSILSCEYTKRVVVWLDNDNEQVIKNARKIYNMFSVTDKETVLVNNLQEPKHLDKPTIMRVMSCL